MENCAEKEEAFSAWNENADEICDKILAEGDSGIIYKHFLCDTKEKLRKTLTDEQKRYFLFWKKISRFLRVLPWRRLLNTDIACV